MKTFKIILALTILTSCSVSKTEETINPDIRKEILGRNFSNTEVQSIEIIEIEHPMLGGIIETTKLTPKQVSTFLSDFDKLKKKGLYKCPNKHIIRLNFESDTFRLKACNTIVSGKNGLYYGLENDKNLIEGYLD